MIQHRIPYKGLLLRHEPPTSNCTCPVAFYSKIPVLLCGISRLLHTPISAFSFQRFSFSVSPSSLNSRPSTPSSKAKPPSSRPTTPQLPPMATNRSLPSTLQFLLSAFRLPITGHRLLITDPCSLVPSDHGYDRAITRSRRSPSRPARLEDQTHLTTPANPTAAGARLPLTCMTDLSGGLEATPVPAATSSAIRAVFRQLCFQS